MFRANRLRIQSLRASHVCLSCTPSTASPCRARPPFLTNATLAGGRAYSDDAQIPAAPEAATADSTDNKPEKPKKKSKVPRRHRVASTTKTGASDQTPQVSTGEPTPEVIMNVYKSLQSLERSYRSINMRMAGLQKEAKESPEDSDTAGKGEKPILYDASLVRQTKKLEAKIATVKGTLNVLKDVLGNQQIPLESLTKRPSDTKASPQSDVPTKPRKGSKTSKGALKSQGASDQKVAGERKPAGPLTSLAGRFALARDNSSTVAAALTANSPTSKTPDDGNTKSAGTTRTGKPKRPLNVTRVHANKLALQPVEQDMPEVPKLSYGLDRALFNPGVYQLQDPHSRVYNFDPYLANIMPINEFDFNALKKYVTSSKDQTLNGLASKLEKKYCGSTSSMTAMLSHFHFLLSAWRPINASTLSKTFRTENSNFTNIMRSPAATFLHLRDGVYSIDADKEFDFASILSMLGKSMEKLLTLPRDEFERYRKKNSDQITEEERNAEEAFHYTTFQDFLMRSQLDAYDPRLPGTGMFDLKTRSVISIRMDATGYQKGLGYELRNRFGSWESFEREYYDMIRSTMLKYSLQVRMGRMDGIFVAYHNTQRIFGFQYISLKEMDLALHGTEDTRLGDLEFKLSLHLLDKVLDRATKRFPGRSIRLHIETRPTNPPLMYIFAKPVTPEQIEKIQTTQHAAIAEYEKEILGLVQEGEPEQLEAEDVDSELEQAAEEEVETVVDGTRNSQLQTEAFWEEMQEKVDATIEDDALGVDHVREAIREALQQSGLLEARSPQEADTYVDALLGVLVRSAKDSRHTKSTNVESGSLAVEVDAAGEMSVSDKASTTDELTETAQANAQIAEAQLLQEVASSTAIEEQDSAARRSRDTGLKELILRLALSVDEKPEYEDVQGADEDAVSDDSKLSNFGLILSELVAKSNAKDSGLTTRADENDAPNDPSTSPEQTSQETVERVPEEQEDADELLGMHLTVRNTVNGKVMDRPASHFEKWDWQLEYSLDEISEGQAQKLYTALKARRRKALEKGDEHRDTEWYKMFKGNLKKFSDEGRRYRQKKDSIEKDLPVHVFGKDEVMTYDETFGYLKEWRRHPHEELNGNESKERNIPDLEVVDAGENKTETDEKQSSS
ncbi:mitochondrial mrna processing protein [Colletotrichum kahawae]|uniref:Mitochondrial mrna processing protein n=1 Tax=Colletotrichum kahawae TaxID=34407 RepID=A0AAD9YRR4_COLKA|nr:mitochondrial mrna processing protein [Colletotrichum kahawae]